MCEWGNTTKVKLSKPQRGSEYIDVDECISSIVQALNIAGIETVASCCGHGNLLGNIILKDNRVIEIHPDFNIWIEQQKANNTVNIHGEIIKELVVL